MRFPPVIALLMLAGPLMAGPAPIPPESVVVLFNETVADSKDLADHYARVRRIPRDHLIGPATHVYWSLDKRAATARWGRIGMLLRRESSTSAADRANPADEPSS